MTDRKAAIRDKIVADHEHSLGILRRLTPEQWALPVPSDEGAQWKARDVLAHLATSESGQLGQVMRLLQGGVTVPDDFDLARFNRRSVEKKAALSVDEMLGTIERDHQEVLKALEAVDEAEFDKAGRHARGDTITVERFFRRITNHRRMHAEELAAALGLTF
jgi:hypothetical protein